jgi:hypothetical protein
MPAAASAVAGLFGNLKLQDRIAQALGKRHERGALELETIEVRARFDGDTVVVSRPTAPIARRNHRTS